MGSRIRTGCLIFTICLIYTCFATVVSYASSEDVQQNESTQLPQDTVTSDTESTDIVQQDSGTEESTTDSQQSTLQDQTSDPTDNQSTVTDTTETTTQDELTSDTTETTDTNPTPPPPKPINEESLWYNKKIPLKREYQKLLWDYCKIRKLDYIDMLSLIYTESNFNEKSSNGKFKGYFQISKSNGTNLAKILKTQNNPLDGKININWGTAIFSSILQDKRVKNLEGKKRRDVALSIFLRGTDGYDRYGISNSYLKAYYKKWDIVCAWFKKS